MSQGEFANDDFSFDDVDPDAPGSFGGGGKLPEGGYRFSIVEVIVKNEKDSTQIECEVICAKDAALVGRKHYEYLAWPDGEHSPEYNRIKKEQLLAWCYAAKTTSPEEIKARQQARQGFSPTWLKAMVGRQVLGFIKQDAYTNAAGDEKTSAKCEGRVWAVDNPKGRGLPGYEGPASPASPKAPTPTAPLAAPVPQQPTADPFAGLV